MGGIWELRVHTLDGFPECAKVSIPVKPRAKTLPAFLLGILDYPLGCPFALLWSSKDFSVLFPLKIFIFRFLSLITSRQFSFQKGAGGLFKHTFGAGELSLAACRMLAVT